MAHLLSVNVGLPRELTWQGKTVRTAVWKVPVEGPRMVRRLNIAATHRAIHKASSARLGTKARWF
jgi:MOSC domain-containing protein YiiM